VAKASQLQDEIKKLIGERDTLSKQVTELEIALNKKSSAYSTDLANLEKEKSDIEAELVENRDKLSRLMHKQAQFDQNEALTAQYKKQVGQLKEKLREQEQNQKRIQDLEKSNRILEETLRQKHPNSIPAMLLSNRPTFD